MNKLGSKVLKLARQIVVSAISLILIIGIMLSIPAVQTWVVGRISSNLSKALETEIVVHHVAIGLTGKLVFDDVLVRDQSGDTLFFVHQLRARLLKFKRKTSQAVLNGVHIDGALVNFIVPEGGKKPNFQFFTEYFAAPEGKGSGLWTILFKDLTLEKSAFRYKIQGKQAPVDRDFDEGDFAFNNINASFKDFYLIGDSLNIKIKNLSTVEKNGLRIKRFACKAIIHWNGIECNDLLFETDHSKIEDQVSLAYNGFPMLSHFIDSVYIKVRLDDSKIGVKDLAYFSHSLNPYVANNIRFTGLARGYLERFKVKTFDIQLGENTVLKGNVDLTGLPDWRSCFTDLNLTEFRSDASDLKKILAISELPERFEKIRNPVFSGHLTGFFSDFAADGVLTSTLGTLRSRISFKLGSNDKPRYSGRLIAEDFDVGQFLSQQRLGKTSFQFDLKEGYGLNFNELKSSFVSQINYVDFNGYRLTNLFADGLYQNQSFDGTAKLEDKNARFTFQGKMDFNAKVPIYRFTAQIRYLNLHALHLDSLPSEMAANLNINLEGSNLDNLNGHAIVSQIGIKRGTQVFGMDKIELEAGFDSIGRQVKLTSDFLDASMSGKYNFSYLDLVYQDILKTLFPDYYVAESGLPHEVDMDVDVTIRENSVFGDLIQQNLLLGNGKLRANYNSTLKSLEVDGDMDELVFDDYRLHKYYLNIRKKPHRLLNMSTDIQQLFKSDSLLTHDILLNASILPNYIDFLLNFADTSDNLALRSYGALDFTSNAIGLRLEQSILYTNGKPWLIDDKNQIWYSQNEAIVETLNAQFGNQKVGLNGRISDNDQDVLELSFEQMDLSNFSSFIGHDNYQTGGIASGKVKIFRIFKGAYIHANMDVYDLTLGSDTVGNVHVETTSKDNPLLIHVDAEAKKGLLKDLTCRGDIDMSGEQVKFDLQIEAKETSVKPFELFFVDMASNFEGSLTAKASLKGTKDKYDLNGYVVAERVGIDIDYLNTRYFVDGTMQLNNGMINFNTLTVKDVEGNKGKLNGSIRHNLFDDFYLDLKLEDMNKMYCLNTTSKDNSMFYGTGVASGSASFKGYLDDLTLDIQATSEKGTKIIIPVYSESDNAIEDYVRFEAPIDTTKIETTFTKKRQGGTGLTFKMALTLTEEAEFELLFDEILDDRITGSGTGNISMEYTSFEDFYMYGDFRISKGIYPFSSPTLVSEKFDLREGGRIVWNGDPYNAAIDLQAAVARNRVNPSDLMVGYISAEDAESYNTKIKMNVILNLKGELFSPDITFGMEFPNTLSTGGLSQFNSLIKRVESDPDELNRQVFSLLTFGSFAPTANYNLASTADPNNPEDNKLNEIVSSSVGSFLSNQVNNWIAEYDREWEVGVDYKTRTGITDEEKAELILSVRRKLFDERLEIAGSFDAYTTGNINPYNVDLVYNLKKDGSLKLKASHKLANDPALGQVSNVSTSGLGFYFKKRFEKIRFRKGNDVVVE